MALRKRVSRALPAIAYSPVARGRGVRFIQLYHTSWDHHGGPTENLQTHLPEVCGEIDQPAAAALVRDLKRRGLLENTIVIWGGEFGGTPMGEVRDLW